MNHPRMQYGGGPRVRFSAEAISSRRARRAGGEVDNSGRLVYYEAKRVMDLDNPPATIRPTEDYFVQEEGTGKYICSVCGYVYDPDEHDGVAFEDLPDDWKCPRCKQPKTKFNKA